MQWTLVTTIIFGVITSSDTALMAALFLLLVIVISALAGRMLHVAKCDSQAHQKQYR